MAWISVGVGVGTAVIGGVSANKAGKRASAAQRQQMQALQADYAFRKQIYEDEKAFRDPLRNMLKADLMKGGSLDYDLKKANVETQYGNAAREMQDEAGRSGTTGSNLQSSQRAGLAISKAKTLSQQWAEGVSQRRSALAALMSTANPMGAANGVSAASGGIANAYGDTAEQQAKASAAGWAAVGSGLGSALGAWSKYQQTPKPEFGIPGSALDSVPTTGRTYDPNIALMQPGVPSIGGGAPVSGSGFGR